MTFFSFLNPFNWFTKEEDIGNLRDYDYFEIKLTDSDKDNSLNRNFKIVRYRYGIPDEPIEYTPEEAKSLKEVEEIPVIFEKLDEDFNFVQETNFGEIVHKIR